MGTLCSYESVVIMGQQLRGNTVKLLECSNNGTAASWEHCEVHCAHT